MKRLLYNLLVLLAISGLISCNKVQRLDTAQMKDLMEDDKIKRITPADLMNKAELLGHAIADTLTTEVLAQQKENPCDLIHSATAKRWQDQGVKIHLLGMPDVMTIRTLLPKELDLLQAYGYAAEKGQPMQPNVQSVADSLWIYTMPIPKEKGIAVKCFSDETYYFSVWSIVFPTKVLMEHH